MAEETIRRRILFVDNNQSIRLTVPRILAKFGFEVTSVASLDDALVEIQTEKFDALLSELNLPEVNSGFVLIEAMRRTQPACINFIMTDHPARENFQRAAQHSVAHYFIKSVDVQEMVSTIKRELTSHDSPAMAPETAPGPKLNYAWQRIVLSAFMEGRPERLPAKVNAAERAIAARLCDPTPATIDEQAALQAALRSLRLLFPANNEESEAKEEIA
jgi:CheY-like chemotaxis protein